MLSALVGSVILALGYLFIVRLVDANEKEPLWAMLLLFALGGFVAALLLMGLPPSVRLSTSLFAALVAFGKLLAIGAGIGILIAYGQRRGWEEVNGTMDGIVYGTCAGMGFGVAAQLMDQLTVGAVAMPGMEPSFFSGLGQRAVGGLADAIPAALIGAGFGAATRPAAPLLRAALPVVGLVLGLFAELGYAHLAHGNALGDSGLLRSRIAFALPPVAIVIIAGYALLSERRTIRTELVSEADSGAVTPDDYLLLSSLLRKQLAYLRTLLGFRIRDLFVLRSIHNLQVQLAFVKDRAKSESDAQRRAQAEAEAARLRTAISERRGMLSGGES